MIPHTQTKTGRNDGDCYRTAFACILDLADPRELPDTAPERVKTVPGQNRALNAWLVPERGLCVADIPWVCRKTDTAVSVARELARLSDSDFWFVMSGVTHRSGPGYRMPHSIAMHTSGEWHDPHPDRTGLTGPAPLANPKRRPIRRWGYWCTLLTPYGTVAP